MNFIRQSRAFSRIYLTVSNRQFHGSRSVKNASPTIESTPMRILLLGSPVSFLEYWEFEFGSENSKINKKLKKKGAGKGTQSSRIQKNFNIATISSGDLLRKNMANGTKIGKIAAKESERGDFVSDDIMIELITNELRFINRKNWLLDGFPRTINQAEALDETLASRCQPINLVINLDVPEDVILQRIMDRWVHVPSGRVYNLNYNPPESFGLDDITGEKLSRRADDNPETFKIRLQKHQKLTKPLLEYYSKRNLLYTFKESTSDEIYPQIEKELLERFGREHFKGEDSSRMTNNNNENKYSH